MILPLVWAACAIAGYLYSRQQNIPASMALPHCRRFFWKLLSTTSSERNGCGPAWRRFLALHCISAYAGGG